MTLAALMQSARRRRAVGYTLVELLVALAILGLLAGMAMPMSQAVRQRERERELKRALWEIRDALDAWRKAREAGAIGGDLSAPPFPPSLVALVEPQPDQRSDRRGQVLRFLRRVPRDPFDDSALPADQTWGLRSYLSEADHPQAGAEVFDVYSRSQLVGLNGVPLRKW